MFEGRLYRIVKEELRRTFLSMEEMIAAIQYAHRHHNCGRDQSMQTIREIWDTSQLSTVIKEYYNSGCDVCDARNVVLLLVHAMPIHAEVGELIFIDFTMYRHMVILNVVDHGSRLHAGYVLQDRTTESVISSLRIFFKCYGKKNTFKKIVCDNGKGIF